MKKEPLTYENAVRKGTLLLEVMQTTATKNFGSQSPFLSFPRDLASNGWVTYPELPKVMDYRGLDIGIKAFNLSKENNVQIEWRQDVASDSFGASTYFTTFIVRKIDV